MKEERTIQTAQKFIAAFPSPEEEALCDIMFMDECLITKPDASFLLQFNGDSMIGEEIMEGDLVIVEKGKQPRNGDDVIAEADWEWTMEYFKKQRGQVILKAANPQYPIIRPKTELRLGGVATAAIGSTTSHNIQDLQAFCR